MRKMTGRQGYQRLAERLIRYVSCAGESGGECAFCEGIEGELMALGLVQPV